MIAGADQVQRSTIRHLWGRGMSAEPEFSIIEAVARYFPLSGGYDHVQAKRFLEWLDHCGYRIVPIQRSPTTKQL
jgi:hypothetical protein